MQNSRNGSARRPGAPRTRQWVRMSPVIRQLAVSAFATGNPETALDSLVRAVAADGTDGEARSLLGIAYSLTERHADARRLMEEALELLPDDVTLRYNAGVVLERAGDRTAAAGRYQAVLRAAPAHPGAWARLGSDDVPSGAAFLVGAAVPVPDLPAGTGAEGPETVRCPRCGTQTVPRPLCPGCGQPLAREAITYRTLDTDSGMSGSRALLLRGVACLIDRTVVGAVWLLIALALGAELVPRIVAFPLDAQTSGALVDADAATRLLPASVYGVVALLFGPLYGSLVPNTAPPSAARWTAIQLYYLMFVAYDVVSHARWGRTLGKWCFGLRLTDERGDPAGWQRVLLRATAGRLAADCPILFFTLVNTCLGYLWVLRDSEQRGWHDRLCRTRVLLRP